MASTEGLLDDAEEPPELLHGNATDCGCCIPHAPGGNQEEQEEEKAKAPSDYVDGDYTALDDDNGGNCQEEGQGQGQGHAHVHGDDDENSQEENVNVHGQFHGDGGDDGDDEDEDEGEGEGEDEDEDEDGDDDDDDDDDDDEEEDDDDDDDMLIGDGHGVECEDGVVLEYDPSRRYGRYAEVLGKGAMKTVYRAFDFVACKEVAWNKATTPLPDGPDDLSLSIHRELGLLERLRGHKSILKLYTSWIDPISGRPNFITELCSSTLLGFRARHARISRKVVRSWARQILSGLVHMHSMTPVPIVHRDLKCENIFLKHRSSTLLKIGDFGSSVPLDGPDGRLHTAIGTPEFMAPEMFEEDYDELVDVYSFGMCLLELFTGECPYSECKSLAEVYKKVSSGQKPRSLSRVKDTQALQLILRCLSHASKRPSASELLLDPFLCPASTTITPMMRWDSNYSPIKNSMSMPNLASPMCRAIAGKPSNMLHCSSNVNMSTLMETEEREMMYMESLCEVRRRKPPICTMSPSCRHIYRVTGRVENRHVLHLSIHIQASSTSCDINFPFDLRCDTPLTVAEEMIRVLGYPESDLDTIANLIGDEVSSFEPNVDRGKGFSTYTSPPRSILPVSPHDDSVVTLDPVGPSIDFCDWPFCDSDATGEFIDESLTSGVVGSCLSLHVSSPEVQALDHSECSDVKCGGDCGELRLALPQNDGTSEDDSRDTVGTMESYVELCATLHANTPQPKVRNESGEWGGDDECGGWCESQEAPPHKTHGSIENESRDTHSPRHSLMIPEAACIGFGDSLGFAFAGPMDGETSINIDRSSSKSTWTFRNSFIGMGVGIGVLLTLPTEQAQFRRLLPCNVKALA